MKNIITSLFILIAFTSCNQNHTAEILFDKMISNPIIEVGLDVSLLYLYDLREGTRNKYQDELYKLGKSANKTLLEKATSLVETKYVIPNIIGPMKEGDVAISLLLAINQILNSDFNNKLIVDEIKEDYKSNGAWVWWQWINKSIDNRLYIIDQLKIIINA